MAQDNHDDWTRTCMFAVSLSHLLMSVLLLYVVKTLDLICEGSKCGSTGFRFRKPNSETVECKNMC